MTRADIELLAIHTLQSIQSITGLGGVPAHDALEAIATIVNTYAKAHASAGTGVPSPSLADTKAAIDALHMSLASNDARIDAMIESPQSPKG